MRTKVLAIVTLLLLAVTACAPSPPDPKTPVDKTTTWETNGLKVAVTFYCTTTTRYRFRSRVTVEVTKLHADDATVEVSFTVVANGNEVDQRPPTKLVNRDDPAWLSQTATEHKAYSIFVYKGDTLIASTRLRGGACAPGDQ